MNKPLLAACLLSFLTCAIHLFSGGPKIHDAIAASNAADYVRAVASVVWHATSATLLINSIALFYAAKKQAWRESIVLLVGAQYLAFAALFIGYGIARFGSPFVMPHWTLFIAILVALSAGRGFTGRKT